MKKLLSVMAVGMTFFLTGCFETTEEITLNEDGTGTYVNTNDMSKVIPIMKNMGQGADQLGGRVIDTSFALGTDNASMEGLSPDEAALLQKGKMHVKVNADEEQLVGTMNFPFASLSEISKMNKLAAKSMLKSLLTKMGGNMPPGIEDQIPEASSFADYYTLEYSNGELKRKLDKDKYANVSSDKYLAQLQDAAGMGIPISYTFVINLPHAAEKVEGDNAKLSDDKKKVTVKSTIDDFFDHPERLEFKVKY